MKPVRILAVAFSLLGLLLFSCRKDEFKPTEVVRPSFSQIEYTVKTGESVEATVENATDLQLLSVSPNLSAEVSGNIVLITGIEAGIGNVSVRANSSMLKCSVKVYDDNSAGTDNPDSPADTETDQQKAAQLADDSERFTLGALTMKLASPGNIFRFSSGNTRIDAISLTTGDELSLQLPIPLNSNLKEGTKLNNIILLHNGESVTALYAELQKSDGHTLWLRIFTAEGALCRLVVQLR